MRFDQIKKYLSSLRKINKKKLLLALLSAILLVAVVWLILNFDGIKKNFFPFDAQKEFDEQMYYLQGDPNRIEIPSAGIAARLSYPKQVSDVDKALKDSIVHLPGTAMPSERGNIVYTGHSSGIFKGKYSSILATISKAKVGSDIYIYRDGVRFDYVIEKKEAISKDQFRNLLNDYDTSQLSIVTCWPIGTDLKRYIVVAKEK